jgi:23S rRNA pseudouridine2605 synthase
MTKQKLQKVLQDAGFDNRRNIRSFINQGRIKVNNTTITDPNHPVDYQKDTIKFEDRLIKITISKKSYFIFHKPDMVVSTLSDPQKRVTIKEFISKISERVYPVGRLDYHSEGLLILTNDGELTNFIISPRNNIPKTYLIKVKGLISNEEIIKLKTQGIYIESQRIRPLSVDFIKKTKQNNSWFRVSIYEGKKHVIRKMFQFIGHPVEKLRRTAIGTIQLRKLPAGHWRELTDPEINLFKTKYHFDTETNTAKTVNKPQNKKTSPQPKRK